ncbi:hypothetical protein RUM44_010223 [Polyplax serrata]|uniref:Uncharacterized protein n=1 Tax=Polyplax serrata TaxID=468196 RepID=A0ABR1AUY9_POLSC
MGPQDTEIDFRFGNLGCIRWKEASRVVWELEKLGEKENSKQNTYCLLRDMAFPRQVELLEKLERAKKNGQTGVAFGIFNKIPGGSSDLNTTTTKKKTLPFRSGLPITVFKKAIVFASSDDGDLFNDQNEKVPKTIIK